LGDNTSKLEQQGLVKIIPSSVAVGSGTGSVNALGTVTFSGASSVSLNDVFSTTYDTYLINGMFTASTSLGFRFRYRVAGSDNSTANSYITSRLINYDPATVAASVDTDSFGLTVNDIATHGRFTMTVYDPFTAIQTYADTSLGRAENTLMTRTFTRHTQATSYDGISFIASTGTITGSIKIYGYNK
jgi:hypothetical protein